MARASVRKNYFNFIAGKNSDASPLVSPENTARTLDNVIIQPDGSISRRLGLDLEEGYELSLRRFNKAAADAGIAIDFYEWKNAGLSEYSYYVIRFGSVISFYHQNSETLSLNFAGEVFASFLNITGFFIEASYVHMQFSQGKGVLVGTSELHFPFYIEVDTSVDPNSPTFTLTKIEIEARDLVGIVDDGIPDDETVTPAIIGTDREYNLFNQGWGETVFYNGGFGRDMDNFRFNVFLEWPNNLEIPHAGLFADSARDGKDSYDANLVRGSYVTGALAPRGKHILRPLEYNARSLIYNFNPIKAFEAGLLPPKSSAFFAGRMWYGGIDGDIYFSQTLTDISKIGKCYQEQSPTSRDFNELVDTDGGVIPLPQAGAIFKVIEASDSLLIFGANGVWAISGGESNFSANSTTVTKVSDIIPLGDKNIVQVSDSIFFWSDEGIFALVPSQANGRYKTEPVSANRTDNDLKLIPVKSKENAFGVYDRINKKIFWAYDSDLEDLDSNLTRYDSAIVYDVVLNAFYDYTFPELSDGETSTFIAGVFPSKGTINLTIDDEVVVLGSQVQVLGDVVEVGGIIQSVSSVLTSAVTIAYDSVSDDTGITFSQFRDRTFTDWKSLDTVGTLFTSVVETRPETLGEASIDKQAKYAHTFYKTDEEDGDLDRGVMLTVRWEWAESSTTGRFSTPQQVIKPKRVHGPTDEDKPHYDGFSIGFSRLKIRGHGKAVVLRYSSEENKDFKLVGWSLPFLGEPE